MKLLIALVNYKTTELLMTCLDSLQNQDIEAEYRIIVVDNHSQDGGVERLRKNSPDVTVIANPTNNGYASAVNQAIRAFDSDYILLLNPDIEVKPGAIDAMLRFMSDAPDAGIVGGKLLNPDGTLQYSCRTFYTLPTIIMRRTFLGKLFPNSRILTRHLMSGWDHNSVRDVDWMLGACLLIRRSALQDVGLMDERFFLYFEDVDWCYRMKKGGWRVCYLPEAEMVHHHQRQSAKGFFKNRSLGFHIKSLLHFYDKWGKMMYWVKKYHAYLIAFLFLLLDILAVNTSFYGSYLIRKHLLLFFEKPTLPFHHNYNFLLFLNLVMPLIFLSLDLYKVTRGTIWVDELFRVGKAVFVSSLLLMAGSFLVQGYEFSRSMIVMFAFLATGVDFALRWGAISWYHSLRKKGFNRRKTLIIGTGRTAAVTYRELQKRRETGFDIAGFVQTPEDDDCTDEPLLFPIVGHVEKITTLIQEHHINELIIAASSDSRELISRCKQEGVDVRLVTDLFSLSLHESTFEEIAGIPMIFFKGNPLFGLNLVLKRSMDVVLSSLGLLLLSPVFGAIAALIKLESPGPVIFPQERIGQQQYPFTMYKFRSMCDNADALKDQLGGFNQASGPLFKIHDDPRLTRVGRFIRKFSLDELPQLWNVLKGDMSLVGPRPPVQREVNEYSEWALKRLDIKPGITGLWQVSGRSDLTFDEMLKLDMYYIWNWSLTNDLKILLRTIPVVLTCDGAY